MFSCLSVCFNKMRFACVRWIFCCYLLQLVCCSVWDYGVNLWSTNKQSKSQWVSRNRKHLNKGVDCAQVVKWSGKISSLVGRSTQVSEKLSHLISLLLRLEWIKNVLLTQSSERMKMSCWQTGREKYNLRKIEKCKRFKQWSIKRVKKI